MKFLIFIFFVCLFFTTSFVEARKRADTYVDSQGVRRVVKTKKIYRDHNAVKKFRKTHPCPGTGKTTGACYGYDVDHIKSLKNGGADTPSNMQWLSVGEHRKKSANE